MSCEVSYLPNLIEFVGDVTGKYTGIDNRIDFALRWCFGPSVHLVPRATFVLKEDLCSLGP
jgi:hypothetical protein